MILLQGHGKLGPWDIDTPALIRFGQLTTDKFFVTEQAAGPGALNRPPAPGYGRVAAYSPR
jgi:hypothetical protein